jgi:hypothetical protein
MSALSLDALTKKGGLVDSRLVPVTKVWKHYDDDEGKMVEDEVSFFVRRGSYGDFARAKVAGEAAGVLADALMVAGCIRLGEKGEEQMTYEQAESLDAGLFGVFREAVAEVYDGAKADPKHSAPTTNFGVKSSSRASAAGQSRKRKRA